MTRTSKPLVRLGCALVLCLVAATAGWPAAAVGAVKAVKVNDPLYNRQWGLKRIGAQEAWKTTQGAGTTIAVVDTGVDRTHEDLKANVLLSKQFDSINDDFDALDLCPATVCHGTAVAGIAAAVANNRKGIAGTAPKAKIMAVRAFGSTELASAVDVTDGINWAADNGADVINLSLGSAAGLPVSGYPPEEVAILYATVQGALVVAAAGNDASPLCTAPAFNPAALCVGASDELDRIADFSNYGARLDVVAPGQSILTTTKFGYQAFPGTSAATPFVAGVGALLMSMGASNLLAAQIIRATAKDLGLPGYDITYGFGRLDAKAAVALCTQIC